MLPRIVEINGANRYLHIYRGFVVVEERGQELGRVALDDIVVLILNAHGLSYTHNLLVEMGSRNIPVVICKKNAMPSAWLWSVEGNYQQSRVMSRQVDSRKPLKKQFWKKLIIAKLNLQAQTLRKLDKKVASLERLASKVRSGDPDNLEAQGARYYWPLLFGDEFRRDRNKEGINTLLNYGYTIIRSACARSIMAAGLHPSLGCNHTNRYNHFCLVDDLMEPFRPLIDARVQDYSARGNEELDAEAKKWLVDSLYCFGYEGDCKRPVYQLINRLCQSYAGSILNDREELVLPRSFEPNSKGPADDEWISYDVDFDNV